MNGQPHTIYFLGIGGIGMSALARYYHLQGWNVSGYDRTPTTLTHALESEGMAVHYEENTDLIPENISMVVYTPAIPADHKELVFLKQHHHKVLKRAEVLGMLTRELLSVTVAGTHGKTTTSTLIAHIFSQSSKGCQAFLGGISKNYQSNFLLSKNSQYVVTEADEYDRSFLQLYPYISVITSVDADHLDIYETAGSLKDSFSEFTSHTRSQGLLLVKHGLDLNIRVPEQTRVETYSLHGPSDYYAKNIKLTEGYYQFDLQTPQGLLSQFRLGIPGMINVENAVAAMAVALSEGIEEQVIREAVSSYEGVKRRFEYRIRTSELVYMDDYAHHPEELRACIESVRAMYPGKKITGIFQPHLFTRTRDFADGFARSLELLDQIILLDIYPAREIPIPGVDSKLILNKINKKHKYLTSKPELLPLLKSLSLEVLLTLGAGDIDQLTDPIEKMLSSGEYIHKIQQKP